MKDTMMGYLKEKLRLFCWYLNLGNEILNTQMELKDDFKFLIEEFDSLLFLWKFLQVIKF